MSSQFHFISGLPRSGSTLLSAILRQNPRFHATMTSPMSMLATTTLQKMSGATEFAVFFDDDRRHGILRGLFDSYYAAHRDRPVIFDTNRTWTARVPLLKKLYPRSRIICCVRDVGWIIDSVEQMLRRNPTHVSRLFNYTPGSTVYGRVETLMNSEKGLIGLAWGSLREAWFSADPNDIVLVRYESLAQKPEETMRRIYTFVEEPYFAHDFDHVCYDEPDYDVLLGMPGMHKVTEKVAFRERHSRIPPDLFAKYAELSFWNRTDLNRSRISVI